MCNVHGRLQCRELEASSEQSGTVVPQVTAPSISPIWTTVDPWNPTQQPSSVGVPVIGGSPQQQQQQQLYQGSVMVMPPPPPYSFINTGVRQAPVQPGVTPFSPPWPAQPQPLQVTTAVHLAMGAEHCDERVRPSVCLSACIYLRDHAKPNLTELSAHVACDRSSILF